MSAIYDFIVLGAGASGLFFAASSAASSAGASKTAEPGGPGQAAKKGSTADASGQPARERDPHSRGPKVLLLERQERPGRKLLLSGGGKCNITNRRVGPENYLSAGRRFCLPALKAFPPERMLDFLQARGIAWEEREYGQIFCRRGAEEVRDALLRQAARNGAELKTGQQVRLVRRLGDPAGASAEALEAERAGASPGWEYRPGGAGPEAAGKAAGRKPPGPPEVPGCAPSGITAQIPPGARYLVVSNGRAHFSRNLLVATGGKAWPRAGSTTFGHALALAAGHAILALRPGLTPLKMPPDWPLHGLQGISLTARVSLAPATPGTQGGGGAPSFTLPLLFTHQGLSGPACLQISSYLPPGGELEVDFLPELRLEDLLDAPANSRSNLQSLLRRHLPERLVEALLGAGWPGELKTRRLAELSRAARQQAAALVHRQRVRPQPPGFGQAESTVGGVDTGQVDPRSMESRLSPGLYFAGEVLDVCGQLGGYNLHWAWASAWLAGRAARSGEGGRD